MVMLSTLLRWGIIDGGGRRAPLLDVGVDVADGAYPPVTRLLIRGPGRDEAIVPWAAVTGLDRRASAVVIAELGAGARAASARHLRWVSAIMRPPAAPIDRGRVLPNHDGPRWPNGEPAVPTSPLPSIPDPVARVLERVGDAFVALDRDWRIIHLNRQAEALLERRREDLLGRVAWEAFPEAVGSIFDATYREALAQGQPVTFEALYPPLGRWFAVRADPTADGLAIYFTDVTEQRRIETALRTSERHLHLALRDSPITLYSQDADLRYTWLYNPAPGYESGAAIGKTDAELLPAEDAAILATIKRGVLETRVGVREEATLRTVNGPRVFDLTVEPLRDEAGGVTGVTGAAVDVTERRAVEDALRRQAGLLDQAYDAIFAWDWGGPITFWNRGAERLYGYRREEAVGRVSHELLRTRFPAGQAAFFDALHATGRWEGELAHTTRDRWTVFVETRQVLVHENGHRYVLEANRDLTDRRRAEGQRRAVVDALAHDLKNPLTTIAAQAQLLRRRLRRADAVDADAVEAGLGSIEAAAARTVALVDEMLDAAYLEAGQVLDLRPEPTDAVALARWVADVFRPTNERHGIRVEAAEAELVGTWDPSRLERVLGNLLSNAIKYSPDGGEIVVTVASTGDDWVALAVRDAGIGIPAADQPRLFDRFYRAANAIGIASGAGIGLAGARQIVEQHGGTIAVESEEGFGSTFTVRLPRAAPAD